MDHTQRDDLLTFIHKALRFGLLRVTSQAGSTNWDDPPDVASLVETWDTMEHLVREHAGHEDRHIFALLERKVPGSVAELGIDHEQIEDHLTRTGAAVRAAAADPTPLAGLFVYRQMTVLLGELLAHFAAEEPVVIERLWATCTDEEIAACRATFLAEEPPQDAIATYELMLPAIAPAERLQMLRSVRAGAPAPVFAALCGVAERTLPGPAWAKLRADLDADALAPA